MIAPASRARVLALVADGELRDELAQGVEGILVLDQTPFYAEMGGQVADHGTIQGPNGTFQVTDVQKNKGGKFMHSGKVVSGTLSVGGDRHRIHRRGAPEGHHASSQRHRTCWTLP